MLAHEMVYTGTAQGRTDRTRAIDQQSMAKWKTALSAQTEHQIISLVGSTMRQLGYT